MTKQMHSSLKLSVTLTFLVIYPQNQYMEILHTMSFDMLGSAAEKLVWSKDLRVLPPPPPPPPPKKKKKKKKKTTITETLHHQLSQVITEEISEETLLYHNQTGSKTSLEAHTRIIIIIIILENFGPSYFLLNTHAGKLCTCYIIPKQAQVQLDEVNPVAGGWQASSSTIGWSDSGCSGLKSKLKYSWMKWLRLLGADKQAQVQLDEVTPVAGGWKASSSTVGWSDSSCWGLKSKLKYNWMKWLQLLGADKQAQVQ